MSTHLLCHGVMIPLRLSCDESRKRKFSETTLTLKERNLAVRASGAQPSSLHRLISTMVNLIMGEWLPHVCCSAFILRDLAKILYHGNAQHFPCHILLKMTEKAAFRLN